MEIATPFLPLITQHYRNKLYYGGRAGGKSFAFADCLLALGREKQLFIACVREVQNSIKDSVYKLLKDRAEFYELPDYVFYEDRIENVVTGTKFIFKGLKDQNTQNIKSLEGVDICWIEEGQSISKKSWEVLNPTIRKPNSEIWISMNREEENDPIWKAVAAHPDERTLVVKVNYYDNPHCPEEMKYLAEKTRQENIDDYNHIWLGAPVAQGNTKLISAKDVREAMNLKMTSSTSPLILGVDIARFGDDKSAICYRRGRWCSKIETYSHQSTVDLANILTKKIKEEHPARVFLDMGSMGAGVYDILVDRGYKSIVRGVNFGGKAISDERYSNKRAEMWGEANEWLKGVVQIPNDDELLDDLCSVNKSYDYGGRLVLEKKDDVKKRIGRSPDKADAFVLTFAEPVYDVGKPQMQGVNYVSIEEMFQRATPQDSGW